MMQSGFISGMKTAEKSKGITAIPALLDLLDIIGSIVTIDVGCQKAIAKKYTIKKQIM